MALQRTQKSLARRIDQTYFRKGHPWRRARKSLTFLCSIGAVAYLAFIFGTGQSRAIHNPGNLMPAHASFQNNCAACHQGTGSRFSLVVTDQACLKCHDAAVHNRNQKNQVMLVNAVAARAANCVDCHVEHRGRAVMMASDDQYCTRCHANLGTGAGATLDGSTHGCPVHVTAFTPEDHPHFGRELRPGGDMSKAMFDPTVLRFNHYDHLTNALHGDQKNCTWCHTPGSGQTGDDDKSPAPIGIATADFKSLRQVSFERNCQVCHDLGTLPMSSVAVPHAPMSVVRAAILRYVGDPTMPMDDIQMDANEQAINDRLVDYLGEQTQLTGHEKQFQADLTALTAAVKAMPISVTGSQEPSPISPQDYQKLMAALDKGIPGTSRTVLNRRKRYVTPLIPTTRPAPQYKISVSILRDLRRFVQNKAAPEDKTSLLMDLARFDRVAPDPRLLEFYVAEANGGSSCILCHDLQGSVAAVPADWAALQTWGTGDVSKREMGDFSTVPTGIPDGPRRWFVNSQFNHDAHRSMSCIECHAAALTSTLTSDVLSPDYQWQGYNHALTALVSRSCFECHHSQNASGPGANANCTECHTYHDRSLEAARPSGPPPATRPSVAMAGP